MAQDISAAAKMLVLHGIKKLAYDADSKRLGDKKRPNIEAGPKHDEKPDVEDLGDEERDELESTEDGGTSEEAAEGESDEEKLRKKVAQMKK